MPRHPRDGDDDWGRAETELSAKPCCRRGLGQSPSESFDIDYSEDPDLDRDDKKKMIIENYGEEKWHSMLAHLDDPDKILWTYSHVLPNFLNQAVEQLYAELV